MKPNLIILFLLLSPALLPAQGREGAERVVRGSVTDSLSGDPLPLATITLITPWDTLYRSADRGGRFELRYTVPDSSTGGGLRLTVAYLGNRPARFATEGLPPVFEVHAVLAPKPVDMEPVNVTGRATLITMKGDTVIYNARTMLFDHNSHTTAWDVVERLPGVETIHTIIRYGSVKHLEYNGQNISAVYVDGKLIFGSDIDDPLTYVEASDIDKVKIYEKEDERTRRKRLIMDLITFSRLQGTVSGETLLSGGADTERGPEGDLQGRYTAGGSYNIFAERNIVKVNAIAGNMGRRSARPEEILKAEDARHPGYRENIDASAQYEHNSSKNNLSLDYAYRDGYTHNRTVNLYNYFASPGMYTERVYGDTTAVRNTTRTHRYNGRWGGSFGKDHFFSFSAATSGTFNRSDNATGRNAFASSDQVPGHRSAALSSQGTQGHNLSNYVHASYQKSETFTVGEKTESRSRRSFDMHLSFDVAGNNGDELQLDTLQSSAAQTWITAQADGRNTSLRGSLAYSELIAPKVSIRTDYSITDTEARYDRLALDNLTGQTDPAMTGRYTDNGTTQKAGTAVIYNNEKGLSFNAGVAFQHYRIDKSEYYPDYSAYARSYSDITSTLSLFKNWGMHNRLIVNYGSGPVYPTIEMIRPRLDITNPLYLRAGNPDVEKSTSHQFATQFNATIPSRTASLEGYASAKITEGVIAARSQYFTRDTPLPQYGDYLAPAGSTLSTWVNAGRWAEIKGHVKYTFALNSIRSIGEFTPSFTYVRSPSYTADRYNVTKTYYPSIGIGLKTKLTRLLFEFESTTSLAYTRNLTGDNVRGFVELAKASVRYEFIKGFFVQGAYFYYIYRAKGGPQTNNSSDRLNLVVGGRVFKNRQGAISIAAFDLLNSVNTYQVRTTAEYQQDIWSIYSGRNITLNFAYRFNKKLTPESDNRIVRSLRGKQ